MSSSGAKAGLALLAVVGIGLAYSKRSAAAPSYTKPPPSGGGGGGGGGGLGGGTPPGPRTPEELGEVDPEDYTDEETKIVLRDLVARANASSDVSEVHAILNEFEAWAGNVKGGVTAEMNEGWNTISDRRDLLARAKYNSLMALANSDGNIGALLHWAQVFGDFSADWYDEANALQDKAAKMQEKLERARDAAAIRQQCAQVEAQMKAGGESPADIQRIKAECLAYANSVQNG